MQPNRVEQHSFELPPPQAERENGDTPEQAAVAPESVGKTAPQQTVAQDAVAAAQPQSATDLNLDDPAAPSQQITDTQPTDRIENEWVERAKTVISSTKNDPFAQKSQMSKVKADYIKKRFNKIVRTDDAVTT